MRDNAFKDSNGMYILRGDIHVALASFASIRYCPWHGFNRDKYCLSFGNSMVFSLYNRNCRHFFPKGTLQAWKLEQNSTHLTLYTLLSLKTCIFLVGQHPNTNQELPSGDCAIAQGMFFKAYQCHRHSTICIEKKSTIKGAQWNPSRAKIHNLSWKIVPRDSSLIGTKTNCNQAQSDL